MSLSRTTTRIASALLAAALSLPIAAFARTPEVGEVFPNFEGTTSDGRTISLEDYRGKVVLVDFWATWCGPCIVEIPNMLEVYNLYNEKGFEIFGISLDNNEEALVNFKKDRNIPWESLYDGKGWETELAQRFGIRGIPALFLLDEDGTVISTSVRGAALTEAVSSRVDPEGTVMNTIRERVHAALLSGEEASPERLREASGDVPNTFLNIALESLKESSPRPLAEPEAGALYEFLKDREYGKQNPMEKDTLAMAAHAAGHAGKAAEHQGELVAHFGGMLKARWPEAGAEEAEVSVLARYATSQDDAETTETIHGWIARHAFYAAEAGDYDAAKASLEALPEETRRTDSHASRAQDHLNRSARADG